MNLLRNWSLHQRQKAAADRRDRRGGGGRPGRCRPRLEALEDRVVLNSYTWTGQGDGTHWSDPANWSPTSKPQNDPSPDLFFPTGNVHRGTNNDVPNLFVHSIDFDGSGTDNYTITGSPFRLGSGGITIEPGVSSTETIGNAISLAAPATLAIKAAPLSFNDSTLTFTSAGSIANNGFLLTVDTAGLLNFPSGGASGATVNFNGTLGGSGGLTKEGLGTLFLTNSNSYTGVTTINAGTVSARNAAALGGSGSAQGTTVNSGGTLEVEGGITLAEPLTLEGNGVGGIGAVHGVITDNALSGSITLAGTTRIAVDGGHQLAITGPVHGAGSAGLVSAGPGRLVLGGNNDYAGATTVSAGTLRLGSSTALGQADGTAATGTTVSAGAALELPGGLGIGNESLTVSGDGTGGAGALHNLAGTDSWAGPIVLAQDATIGVDAGQLNLNGAVSASSPFDESLTKVGTGTLLFGGGGSNTYSGTTTVDAGTLALAKTGGATAVQGALVVGDDVGAPDSDVVQLAGNNQVGSAVTVNSSGLLDLHGHSDVVLSLTLQGGDVRTATPGPVSLVGVLTVALGVTTETSTRSASISGKVAGGQAGLVFDVADSPGVHDDLVVSASLADGGGKRGPGRMVLSGFTTDSIDLGVSEGTLTLRTSQPVGPNGTLSVGGDGGDGVIEIDHVAGGVGKLDLSGDPTGDPTGVSVLHALAGTSSWAGLVVAVEGSPSVSVDAGGQLTLTGTLTTFLTPNLTKAGDGVLALAATGDGSGFTATMTVAAGTLQVDGTLGGPVVVNDGFLTGTGTVAGIHAVGGTVDPGDNINSPGILHSSADVTLEAGSILHADLKGVNPGTDNDQLQVTGAVTSNSAELDLAPGTTPFTVALDLVHASGPVSASFTDPITKTVPGPGQPIHALDNEQFDMIFTANDFLVQHHDTGSAFQDRSVTGVITEGNIASVRGTIVEPDPQDSFTLLVSWGDRTPVQTFTFPPGSNGRQVTVLHRYADDGNYTVHLSWHDPEGAGNSADMAVAVSNVAPVVDVGPDAHLRRGGVLNRRGSFLDPGSDSWTATVDYGDGSGPQALRLGPDKQLHLRHRYRAAGTYAVTVTVRDDDGGVGTAQLLVVVS
jgi:autotransporter-associated beta strand protein